MDHSFKKICMNKDKSIRNCHPGMYELKCLNGSVYNAEVIKKTTTRSIVQRLKKVSKVKVFCSK